MSTKDNFEQDRERKRREAMTGDQRALESALASLQALKEQVDTLKEWQSRFAINGKTVTGGDGDNQWAINAGVETQQDQSKGYPWIGDHKNEDGTYYAWFGLADASFVDSGTAAVIENLATKVGGDSGSWWEFKVGQDIEEPLFTLGAGGHELTLYSYKIAIDGAFCFLGASGVDYVCSVMSTAGPATGELSPSAVSFSSEAFKPADANWFNTSGGGMAGRILASTISSTGQDIWNDLIKSRVQSEIRTALATGTISMDCDAGTVTLTFTY